MQIEWNSTSVGDASTALVQGRSERRPIPAPETNLRERPSTGGVARRSDASAEDAGAPDRSIAAAIDAEYRPLKSTTANPWRDRIPTDAMFYTEVADLAAGIGQVGRLVSVRV